MQIAPFIVAGCAAVFAGAAAAQMAPSAIETEHSRATLLSERSAVAPGESIWVALKLELDPGWHTYWKNPGDSGLPGEITWTLPAGVSAEPIAWPIPERVPYGPLMNFGFHDTVILPVKLTVAADAAPVTGAPIAASAMWLVCADVCIPDQGDLALPLTIAPDGSSGPTAAAAEIAAARDALPRAAPWPVTAARAGDGWQLVAATGGSAPKLVEFYPDEGGLIDNAAEQRASFADGKLTILVKADPTLTAPPARLEGLLVVAPDAAGPRTGFTIGADIGALPTIDAMPAMDIGIVTALLFAFLGGLILNLMPCVLPVLAMKAVALSRGSDHARREGLAYTAGAMVTFALLAVVLLGVRAGGEQMGWGFQLQEPGFVAAMAAIVLALGLMLSGVFTVGGGIMGLGQAMTARRDWVGAFFTGALAVVVATPCTAPFMGSAMAYAVSQPFIVSLLVFEALALGLAAPFLLVSLVPAIAYLIPKPGAWMDTFKQILAFPMYATAAWLVWVLTQQTGPDGVAAALAGLVLVALALWIYGHGQRMGAARPVNVTAGIAAAALALAALVQVGSASRMTAASAPEAVAGLSSEPFTEARLAALRAEGRPVFVNFTAAWCITCLVNERMAFSSADVIDAMTQKKVVYLKADWTNYDPAISKVLAAYGRVGVPLYLYFAPNAGKAEILPQILTPGALTAALAGGVATR